jgi:hypothetical protein
VEYKEERSKKSVYSFIHNMKATLIGNLGLDIGFWLERAGIGEGQTVSADKQREVINGM